MPKTFKYLIFTFISAYILQIIASHDLNLDSYGGMMSASGKLTAEKKKPSEALTERF